MKTESLPQRQRWWHWLIPAVVRCEFCGWPFDVKHEDSRTMYFWNGEGEDPNRSRLLCRQCADYHHSYWDEMWAEYSSW